MSQQHITIGTANAGNGDTPFSAFTKVEANFTDIYSKGFGLSSTVVLSAATTVSGTSSNTLQYIFNSLGTTRTNGAGLYFKNATAALTGAQQISPIITQEGSGFTTSGTPSQTIAYQQYVLPVQSSNLVPYGALWFDASLSGNTPTHTLGVQNINVLSLPGTNAYANASGLEIYKNSTPSSNNATIFIGAQGNTEVNLSYNMDYHNIQVNEHHAYDNALDLCWYYMSPTSGMGVQATKAGYNNAPGHDVWVQGGSAVPIKFDFIKNGSGDYVTGGNKMTGQQIELIDDNLSSPNAALKQSGTIFFMTGMDNVSMPRLNVGSQSFNGFTAVFNNPDNEDNRLDFINTNNNTNSNVLRFLKNKAGSYTIGAGTNVYVLDANTIAQYGTRGTSTVLGGFSNIEHFWTTTNAAGSTADRMVLGQEGTLTLSGGKIIQDTTITAGGTTGNQTINKATGTVNIAAAGASVTVTNSLVTTSSLVYTIIRTNDTTATIKNVVPGSGSFVITLGASATAEVSIGFIVFN